MSLDNITIRGARTHNLKNIDLELPRDQLIVITGLSGSGKSSLAFDTIYAEGQRRYVESLSAYARQFLSLMEKPDVDNLSGTRDITDDSSGCITKKAKKRKRRPAIPWDVMYQHLLAFKERFGHVKVTQKYVTEDGVKVRPMLAILVQSFHALHLRGGK